MGGMRGLDRFYGFFYRSRRLARAGRLGGGFTLLELLAVVATIVIFSSILMTSNQNAINQSNRNLQAQQEAQLKEALQMWVLNNGLAKAKEEWRANIKNDPEKILEIAKTMLSPSTRGVYRLSGDDKKIVSDASTNMGSFFDVSWDVDAIDPVLYAGPVVNPTAVPVPSVPNPSPAPSASPGVSPGTSPGPGVSPSPGVSPEASPGVSPGVSPPATASPTPELITVAPYLQEASLSLLLFPRAVLPNAAADLKVVAANPASVPLNFILSGQFPAGLQVLSWDSPVKADASLNAGAFSWQGQIPANGAVEIDFKISSGTVGSYKAVFTLEAADALLSGGGFQNVDEVTLLVSLNPPPPGTIWDFAPVSPAPDPVVKGSPITLAVAPVYLYNPAVNDVYMSVSVPSSLFYLGLAEAAGAQYLGQEILGTTRVVRFYLGRGDRDLSGVKPKLIFYSNDEGVAQTTGGLGRTLAASEYSEALNSLTWLASTPTPTPTPAPFEVWPSDTWVGKGPRPAPTPVVIKAGDSGELFLGFRNVNTSAVGYTVKITATGALMNDPARVENKNAAGFTIGSTLTITGTAPERDIVDLSSRLKFISLTDAPAFTVEVSRTGQPAPDLPPRTLNW